MAENGLSKSGQSKFSTHLDKKKNLAQSISSDSQNSKPKDISTKFSKSTSSRTFKTNNQQKNSNTKNQQTFSTPNTFYPTPTNEQNNFSSKRHIHATNRHFENVRQLQNIRKFDNVRKFDNI